MKRKRPFLEQPSADKRLYSVFRAGITPLINAIIKGNNELSLELIASGVDINARAGEHTALILAVERNNVDIIRALVQAGADVSGRNGLAALSWAAEQNNTEIANLVIEKGADLNEFDDFGKTALCQAALNNSEEVLLLLLNTSGIDVNSLDNHGHTALVAAVMKRLTFDGETMPIDDQMTTSTSRRQNIIRALAKACNVNIKDFEGKTALSYAIMQHEQPLVRILVDSGADVNIKDGQRKTALFYAIKQNEEPLVRILVDSGADVNKKDGQGKTALFYAIKQNEQPLVRILVDSGADVSIKDGEGKTALFYAIKQNEKPLVRILVDNGADVNIKDDKGKTALFYAVEQREELWVRYLIDAGADVSTRDTNQETLLFNAVRYNNTKVIELLVDHPDTEVNVRNVFGRTPLFYAVTSELPLQTARLLLDKGANLNDTDSCDFSVLSFYIEHQCYRHHISENKFKILELFIENGIQIDKIFTSTINLLYSKFPSFLSNFSGLTTMKRFVPAALTIARKYAHNDEQKRMLENFNSFLTGELALVYQHSKVLDIWKQLGAKPNSVDSDGNTALHYTLERASSNVPEELTMKILLQLENHGARFNIRNKHNETPLLFFLKSYLVNDIKKRPRLKTIKEICRHLLKCDVQILNETARNGESVFHVLITLFRQVLLIDIEQTPEIVELLELFCPPGIVERSNVNKTNDKLQSPLHLWALLSLATKSGYARRISGEQTFEKLMKSIFNILRKCGVMLNARDTKDQTPLHYCRTWSAVKCLVEAGAKRNDHDSNGIPPLLAAAHEKVFMINSGHFFPDVTDDPKSFFTICVELDLDLWACDNKGKSVFSLLLAAENVELAKALVEVACELKPSVLWRLMMSICKDKSPRTFFKSLMVELILKCTTRPQKDLNSALRRCCLNIKSFQEKKDNKEQQTLRASVHLDIARHLRLHGADGESCTDLSADFPQLLTFLTEKIDLSQIPVSIPWISDSTNHETKLGTVARRQNFEQIGTYWFHKEPIGGGSFGDVFAGINEKDGREIAIKKILKSRMVRPEDKREIRNLTALADCQQVVTYIYFDDSDKNFAYIVLELMEGHLDDYFTSSSFDPRHNFSLCKDLVMGLKFLHDHKPKHILHRDLKPGNILYKVHPKICLKIADFGLSSPLTATGTTVLGTQVGTRCWIAPEVIRSKTYKHSMASDNYSCGLLLHYILSLQKHPFSPADCSNKTREIIDLGIQTNMQYNTTDGWDNNLSPEATHLVKGLLSSNVAERPSAAESLSHPLFWTNKKKLSLLTAVGNQSDFGRPIRAYGPMDEIESDLEDKVSIIVQHPTWIDASYSYMPSLYVEMSRRRPYNTRSVVELVRFIRNARGHGSDRDKPSYFAKQIFEDAVFLIDFPHLVIEVFKFVTKHGWDTRKEIKEAMSSE